MPQLAREVYCVVSLAVQLRDELILTIIVVIIATAGWIWQVLVIDIGRFGVVVTVAVGEFHLASLVNAARPRRHPGYRV